MKKFLSLLVAFFAVSTSMSAANKYDNPDTLYVSKDGTCEFSNVQDAVEVCRAFMDYHKVIFVKNGTYKEKVIVPSWLTNIEICGEDAEKTIITYDDHANIVRTTNDLGTKTGKIGTFRTYTVKIEGTNITLKNITVENNAPKLGQAVALHTEGDKLVFIGCRFLGNQDTIYTGTPGTRCYFYDCYIEGTTDFIFGPSIAWFEKCLIKDKSDSYVTAANTPKDQKYGYIFNNCKIIADAGVTKCYLGRPWRPYAYTLFMNCEIGKHVLPIGWNNWSSKENEKTARYMEYNNHGEGATKEGRAAWAKQLTKKEASVITIRNVLGEDFPLKE